MLEIIRAGKRASGPVLAALLACAATGHADQIEYTAYYFGDNNDNTVATTSFSLAKTLWRRTMILLDVELDQTTVPPLDGVTGASRPARQSKTEFRKNRGQIIGGVEQGLGENTKVVASYYFSQEPDYQSESFIGGVTREFFRKNFTVSLRAQYTMDSVGEILANGTISNLFKETHQASLILTQLLSPTTILRVGGDAVRNHGYLSDPYRKVPLPTANPLVDDTVSERHPGMRYRQAAWGEISQYLNGLEASLIFHYRYYWDDWGVTSHTGSLKINKYVTKDWIFSPEYRYYEQTAADFGEYGRANPGGYDAEDYKLKMFSSNNAGAGVTCFLRAFSRNHPTWDFLNNSSISVMYFRYFNDTAPDNFSANVLESRLKFTF
ncbi:MAG TPA: DUF3570 domain-containing protein [Fibrobacteria bacterium]|nr:DUF3570 domain-containing protein [Fibrobacteria bacterium]